MPNSRYTVFCFYGKKVSANPMSNPVAYVDDIRSKNPCLVMVREFTMVEELKYSGQNKVPGTVLLLVYHYPLRYIVAVTM